MCVWVVSPVLVQVNELLQLPLRLHIGAVLLGREGKLAALAAGSRSAWQAMWGFTKLGVPSWGPLFMSCL